MSENNVLTLVFVTIILSDYLNMDEVIKYKTFSADEVNFNIYKSHEKVVEKFYEIRKYWVTSNLGSILFKHTDRNLFRQPAREAKTFVVQIWRYWSWLKRRLVFSGNRKDVLKGCSVQNCEFTGNDSMIQSADAVLVLMVMGNIPPQEHRHPGQRWVLMTEESPQFKFLEKDANMKLTNLENVFNWTMTYRTDSDVPIPYGRTIPLTTAISSKLNYRKLLELIPYWSHKQLNVLASVVLSNCEVNDQLVILQEFKKYIHVDIHGECSDDEDLKESCTDVTSDCIAPAKYIFYLVLENSHCRQYITERTFTHAYSKGAIPIIVGTPLQDCKSLLPPHSFIHIEDYKTVEDLAVHVKEISEDSKRVLSYHVWRNHYEVRSEHGFFGTESCHLCRLCEALNYNDGEPNVYDIDNLTLFFDERLLCKR